MNEASVIGLVLLLFVFVVYVSRETYTQEFFTAPPLLYIALMCKKTRKNLLANQILEKSQIQIHTEENENVDFDIVTEKDKKLIKLSSLTWERGERNYKIFFNNGETVTFSICIDGGNTYQTPYYNLKDFSVKDREFHFNPSTHTADIVV